MRMNTKIYLYDKTTHAEIPINSAQLATEGPFIGKSGPFQNDLIDPERSFREFHAATPQTQSFKDQVIEALSKGEGFYSAPGTQDYARYLADPELRKNLYVLTARGHLVNEFMDGQKVLLDRGIISALPIPEHIILADNPILNPTHIPTAEFKAKKIAEIF